ncbi:MAG: fold metallo-hydrolase, partial [Clostridia bacterium]|nr:fold metallo-hydrolase [Clostridia bacterium]
MERIRKVILENDYFRLFELADGAYAAIEKENNTGSNAGIIDLGSGTVIFDTFLNSDAAKELKKASEKLTGNSVQYVINSHGHTDHILGNYLFPAATAIISSEPVRASIAKASTEFEKEKDLYPPRIKEIEDILSSGDSAENKADLLNELQFLSNLVKPGVEIRVPNLTFAKDMVLHGSKRS